MSIYFYLTFNIIILSIQCLTIEEATKDMELLLAFVVHNHGERTPEETLLNLSENKEYIAKLSKPFGVGSITNSGKKRAYEIGKYLRNRYNSLLSKTYKEEEIYLKSTDFSRTRQTLEISLTAMYTENAEKWTPNVKTLQIPYNVTPVKDDFLYYFEHCKNSSIIELTSTFRPEMMRYRSLVEFLTALTPLDFTTKPLTVYIYYEFITSEIALGLQLPEWLEPHWHELVDASDLALHLILEKDNRKRQIGGLLLNDFIEVSNAMIKHNYVSQRVRIFSVHDINVAALMAISLLTYSPNKNGAVFSLELYKMKKYGEYYVLPIFLPQAGNSTATVLSIEGCSKLCSLNDFTKLTENNALTEETLKRECEK